MTTRCIPFLLIVSVLLAVPAPVFAADSDSAQAKLLAEKLFEIIPLSTILIWIGIRFGIGITIAVVAARVCFGPESLFIRLIKFYVYSFLTAIGVVLGVGAIFLMAGKEALLPAVGLGALLVIVLAFAIPMKVFEAGFLRVLVFLIVSVIFNALGKVALNEITKSMVEEGTDKKLEKLFKDYDNKRVRADWDYAKNSSKSEEPEQKASVPTVPTIQQEAASLKVRMAALQERYAKLDKSNAGEVAQYNADYKKYTDDVTAFNAKVKAASAPPVSPAPKNQ